MLMHDLCILCVYAEEVQPRRDVTHLLVLAASVEGPLELGTAGLSKGPLLLAAAACFASPR